MLNVGDLSQASVSDACQLGKKAHDVLSNGFFSAVDVEIFHPVFRSRVEFLQAAMVETVQVFCSPPHFLD